MGKKISKSSDAVDTNDAVDGTDRPVNEDMKSTLGKISMYLSNYVYNHITINV
jgi:hypothetical protein